MTSLFYRPLQPEKQEEKKWLTTSIVVPVYNENPEVFKMALQSWLDNGIDEIVAVIDYTDRRNMFQFHMTQQHTKAKLKLIVSRKPGKRPCLADGVLQTTGDVIFLVDSDTIWGPDVIKLCHPYFRDPKIGGVTVRQKVYNPKTLSQVLFDLLLHLRYTEEVPFLVVAGHVVNTLSGRTAVYRRQAVLNTAHDNIHLLTHEFYLKSRCISGDDKRLTHLILEQGWHVAYQGNAVVYTPGTPDMKTFLKQRLRWTRNSWRADTRAFAHGWVWRHPVLAYFNLDRFMQPFFLVIGFSVFILSLIHRDWLIAAVILFWWLLTRFLRLSGYFYQYPRRIIYLPAYVVFTFWVALVKLYAWFTIVEQGWITRWHAGRLNKTKKLAHIQGTVLTAVTVVSLLIATNALQKFFESYHIKLIQQTKVTHFYSEQTAVAQAPAQFTPRGPERVIALSEYKTYTVQSNDSLSRISSELIIPIDALRRTNYLTDWNLLEIGQKLYYR